MHRGYCKEGKMAIIGGLLLLTTMMGVMGNCMSMFIIPVTTGMGWTRGQFSLAQSMMSLMGMFFSLNCSRFYSKAKVVTLMKLGAVTGSLAYFSLSYLKSLPMLYVLFVIMGLSSAMTTTLPVSILISRWIPENTGAALGLAMMGSGLGGMIFNPVISAMLNAYGWRVSYRIMAAIMFCCSMFAVFFLMKEKPEDPKPVQQSESMPADAPRPAFLTSRNLLFCAISFFICILGSSCNSTLSPYLQDIGFTQNFAAAASSVALGTLAAGKVIYGMMIDKCGLKLTLYITQITGIAGLLGLLFFRSPMMLPVVYLNMALCCPYASVINAALAQEVGAPENKDYLMGKFNAVMAMANMANPILLGMVYDSFGSYTPYYWFCVVTNAVMILLVGSAFKHKA